jgi:hypothetical protein
VRGIRGEDAGPDHRDPVHADQPRPPPGDAAAPEAGRPRQGEDAEDDEVRDLHPSGAPEGELAQRVHLGVVRVPAQGLGDGDGDEEGTGDDAAGEQGSGAVHERAPVQLSG